MAFPRPDEGVEKALQGVIPAKAGVQRCLKTLDSGLRQNDENDDTAHLSTPFDEGKQHFLRPGKGRIVSYVETSQSLIAMTVISDPLVPGSAILTHTVLPKE